MVAVCMLVAIELGEGPMPLGAAEQVVDKVCFVLEVLPEMYNSVHHSLPTAVDIA